MTRRRRLLLAAVALVAIAACAIAYHLGWTHRHRPWREATGWNRIPESERAPFDLSWNPGDGEAPRLDWLGHAGFLVTWHGARVLLDPNLSDVCSVSPRVMERPVGAGDLGAVDAVLLSHAHYDHMDEPTLRALWRVGALVLPAGSESYVVGLRADARIVGLTAGGSMRVGPRDAVEVIAVPAAHNGSRHHPLPSDRFAAGYVLRAGNAAIYYAGDTGRSNDFETIGRTYRPALAILPIGAYAPSFPLRLYHLSPEDAVEVARRLGVDAVVPAHFGTFVLSLDRPDAALPRFARAAKAAGLSWTMPALLARAPAGNAP